MLNFIQTMRDIISNFTQKHIKTKINYFYDSYQTKTETPNANKARKNKFLN